MRQLRTYKSPIVDRDGITVLGTVGIGHDVTDLVNMSAEIEILLQSMPYAILLWDNNGKILNANRLNILDWVKEWKICRCSVKRNLLIHCSGRMHETEDYRYHHFRMF